ncbi:hypothetical protein S7711_10700 [Stachybotrys chartarum IBT 7711]|uniref:Uncharacterized protein n=1 Tax=Stachybotrys chartarum (strain CBS 109288 / IBT 7711) TaxID=1280523 RepID=A0A084AXW1_STACB|nr:hypothetical protein S7711_10700 [Stachybotrys chartarum IBT 7711]
MIAGIMSHSAVIPYPPTTAVANLHPFREFSDRQHDTILRTIDNNRNRSTTALWLLKFWAFQWILQLTGIALGHSITALAVVYQVFMSGLELIHSAPAKDPTDTSPAQACFAIRGMTTVWSGEAGSLSLCTVPGIAFIRPDIWHTILGISTTHIKKPGPLLALRTLVSLTTVAASDRDALTTALSGYIKDLDIAATLMQGFGVRCHSFVERILFVNFVTLERINGLSIGGEARSPSFLRVWNALTARFGFGKNQIRGIETLYIYLEHTKGVIEILQRIQASTEHIAMAFDDCGKSLLKVEEKCDRFLAKAGIAFIEDQSSSVANVFSRLWRILGSEMFRIDDQRQMLGLLGNITTEIEIGRGLIVDMKAHLSIVISQLEIVHQGLQQSLLPTGSCPRQC